LRVHPSFGPVFALTLPESSNANDIEADLNANFTNLRAAMFLVDEKTWFGYLCQVELNLFGWFLGFSFKLHLAIFSRPLPYSDGTPRQRIALIAVATSNETHPVDNASAMVFNHFFINLIFSAPR
jgi:hypothetical protein